MGPIEASLTGVDQGKPLKMLTPAYSWLDRNRPGTPETRRNANTYLEGYGPAGGKGERRASDLLSGGGS